MTITPARNTTRPVSDSNRAPDRVAFAASMGLSERRFRTRRTIGINRPVNLPPDDPLLQDVDGLDHVSPDVGPTPAAAVMRAAKELHDDLANPINEVIQAARSQHEARVAALEAERYLEATHGHQ